MVAWGKRRMDPNHFLSFSLAKHKARTGSWGGFGPWWVTKALYGGYRLQPPGYSKVSLLQSPQINSSASRHGVSENVSEDKCICSISVQSTGWMFSAEPFQLKVWMWKYSYMTLEKNTRSMFLFLFFFFNVTPAFIVWPTYNVGLDKTTVKRSQNKHVFEVICIVFSSFCLFVWFIFFGLSQVRAVASSLSFFLKFPLFLKSPLFWMSRYLTISMTPCMTERQYH